MSERTKALAFFWFAVVFALGWAVVMYGSGHHVFAGLTLVLAGALAALVGITQVGSRRGRNVDE